MILYKLGLVDVEVETNVIVEESGAPSRAKELHYSNAPDNSPINIIDVNVIAAGKPTHHCGSKCELTFRFLTQLNCVGLQAFFRLSLSLSLSFFLSFSFSPSVCLPRYFFLCIVAVRSSGQRSNQCVVVISRVRYRAESGSIAVGRRRLLGRDVRDSRGGGVLRLTHRRLSQRAHVLPPLQAGGILGRIQRGSLPGTEEALQAQRDHDRPPEHRTQQNEQLHRQPTHLVGQDGQREELERRHDTRHETCPESQENLRLSIINNPPNQKKKQNKQTTLLSNSKTF